MNEERHDRMLYFSMSRVCLTVPSMLEAEAVGSDYRGEWCIIEQLVTGIGDSLGLTRYETID